MSATNSMPTRGLVIAEPWISEILAGRKTWEMRTKATDIRGRIGLIRKGSGLVVGTVELVDSLPALNAVDLAAHERRHGVSLERQAHMLAGGWVVPWVLRGARAFLPPIRYVHPPGAVIWVTLNVAAVTP
jgi:hypothetical protein